MKIMHYVLFVMSGQVKNYLFKKGVDPDTVYLNDFKFMQRIFHILVITSINKCYRSISLVISHPLTFSSSLSMDLLNRRCYYVAMWLIWSKKLQGILMYKEVWAERESQLPGHKLQELILYLKTQNKNRKTFIMKEIM